MREAPPRSPTPGPPVRIARPWPRRLQLVAAAAGWLVFVGFWAAVFTASAPREGLRDVLVVGVLFAATATATAIWIRHNLLLARRLGERRRAFPEREPDWTRDTLGRPVEASDWDALRGAPAVEVALDRERGVKTYRAV